MWFIVSFNYYSFTIMFPYVIQQFNQGSKEDSLQFMILGSIPELLACIWLYFFIEKMGRVNILKLVTVIAWGIIIYMYSFQQFPIVIYLFSLVKGLFCLSFDTLIPYTCEIYNTNIRSIAFSFFNTQARIAGILMPLVVFPIF